MKAGPERSSNLPKVTQHSFNQHVCLSLSHCLSYTYTHTMTEVLVTN